MMHRIATIASLLGFVCFLLQPAFAAQPPPYVNVLDYGATADQNGDDDAPAIEAAIADACAGNGPRTVYFPKGEYVIASTVNIPFTAHSLKFFGAGMRRNGNNVVKPTQISWNGADCGVMFDCYGITGLTIIDMTINGDYQYNATGKAGIGIDVRYMAGSPSSEFYLERVLIEHCDTGFQCENEPCNSDMTFIDVAFSNCTVGFRTLGGQNVDFVFIRPECGFDVPTANTVGYWFAQGSTAVFHQLSSRGIAKVIEIDAGGVNGGCLAVYGWLAKMDPIAGFRPTLLDIGGNASTVQISSLYAQANYATPEDNPPLFVIRGRSVLNVIGSQISSCGIASVGNGAGRCLLTFDTCQFGDVFDPRLENVITNDGDSGYIVRDCTLHNGLLNYRRDQDMDYVPMTPTNLVAMPGGATGQIRLTWTDSSNDEDRFGIARWNGANWGEIATVGANVTTFTDTGRTVGTVYQYRVYAITNPSKRWIYSDPASSIPRP